MHISNSVHQEILFRGPLLTTWPSWSSCNWEKSIFLLFSKWHVWDPLLSALSTWRSAKFPFLGLKRVSGSSIVGRGISAWLFWLKRGYTDPDITMNTTELSHFVSGPDMRLWRQRTFLCFPCPLQTEATEGDAGERLIDCVYGSGHGNFSLWAGLASVDLLLFNQN